MKRYFVNYVLLLLVLFSCNNTDYYVGGYEDMNYIEPIHESLILNSNGIFISNYEKYNKNDISVNLDSTEYRITEQYIDVRDYTKTLATKYDFKRYVKGISSPIDSNVLYDKLVNHSWKTTSTDLIINNDFKIETNLTFNKTGEVNQQRIYRYKNVYIYHENEKLEYNIVSYYKSLILLLTNTKTDQKFPALQLKKSNKDELVFQHVREINISQDTFTINDSNEEYSKDHNLVSYCNYKENEYAYGNRASNSIGSEGILKYCNSIKREKNENENGSVTINFDISCKNKIGRFGLEQLNSSFERTEFSYDLIATLFDTVIMLEWSINTNNDHYKLNDEIHAFLTFKIRDGEITDVTP